MNDQTKALFLEAIWDNYAMRGRALPWRAPEADGTFDGYKILLSEMMLQQTQVGRVIPKYQNFLSVFPTLAVLARADLGDVLKEWSGLGYYRRAKYLHQTAQILMNDYDGRVPDDTEQLKLLPGIGGDTAAAIVTYTYNKPNVFIETNVRTVYIHHFFADEIGIPDKTLRSLVADTLDRENPREFYWAIMDYGSYLKQSVGNLSRQSAQYARQSRFEGSLRQVRGKILKALTDGHQSQGTLEAIVDDKRCQQVCDDLMAEGLIKYDGKYYHL